ncbi:MAG: DHH family phosphoesterase [Odoribacter sp.]|nr:DHH family phosphoesterase [Odoribacter sp.]
MSKPPSFIIPRIGPVFPVLTELGFIIAKVKSLSISRLVCNYCPDYLFRIIFYLCPLLIEEIVLETAKYTKELSNLLFRSENILFVCHINPDGDAIGSQLALYHYLAAKGKHAEMLSPNNLQEFLKWMDGAEKINIFIRDRKKCKKLIERADLIVLFDFNHSDRLGEAEEYILKSKAKKIIIDHHLDSENFVDLIIADTTKCSTSELVHEIVQNINGEKFLSKPYGEAVYVGILTDTGNFEHGAYSGSTFRIVADIIDSGIEKSRIFNLVYNNFSADRLRLQGLALDRRLVVLPEFRTAYIFLTKSDLLEYNYKKGDTEGFVNMPLSINGIDFTVLFVEKKGYIKLSFRSKGSFSVNDFARKHFKGGGHLNAAGGDHYDTLEKTIEYFLRALTSDAPLIIDKLLSDES